jgi:alkylation response protein AidB-like acyl-CoA dehydrogenase
MALTAAQLAKQKKEAEELLFSGPETFGFAKALFFGHFNAGLVFPYPTLPVEAQNAVDQAVAKVRQFAQERIDPVAIDRAADIPRDVIDGLAALGVLGMTAPAEFGGQGFSQLGYTKIIEAIGARCSSTAVFVNAHHSIGIRALLLFGTTEQKAKWLPDLVAGRKLAAFALTEAQAGSDAANVQTKATPTEDGSAYILNGDKRYITNAAIADVLTVMARTPAPTPQNPNESKITAFLVTPDMPGFEIVEGRMPKCGIRGTATGRLRFTNMRVPKENVLYQVGKGLRVALTVLDFGRTTFGASCTGAAKVCLQAAVKHAKSRIQFQQPIAEFELVKKKIAFAAAHTFAMEAATTQCAAFIDRGAEDYMLETAILKIFATEHLWTIINDTIQIFGGKAYFTDEPYERMMRDARINTIGEGANDVLKAFVAVVGSRAPGMRLDRIRKSFVKITGWAIGHLWKWTPVAGNVSIPVQHADLSRLASGLAKRVKRFGLNLPWVFKKCGTEERFIQAQYLHERMADIAIDLYVGSCVLSRLDHMLTNPPTNGPTKDHAAEIEAGEHFLHLAFDRIDQNARALFRNSDESTTLAANAALGRW